MAVKKTEFTYRFIFSDGRAREAKVELDTESGRLKPMDGESVAPAWTELEHQKCMNCPLSKAEHPHCPVAVNLAKVAADFSTEKSFEKIVCEVVAPERSYRKNLPLQEGLFGIFGLIMATSSCPHMSFLRPMAQFHLPFSSLRETMVRSVSFYLFRQYFVARRGEKPDFELKAYAKLYEEIETVNRGIVGRIRSIAKADADMNSIVILDGFAKLLSLQLQDHFSDFEKIFTPD